MPLHLVPRSLHYFEQVAQFGSIQAASRELGISASAIHRQIVAIEDALGEPLLERETKGVSLTQSGQLLLEVARSWRLDNARLLSVVQSNRGVEQGHIRIAAMDGMVNGLVPELVAETARRFPRLQIGVEIMNPGQAVKRVLNGDTDIAAAVNIAQNEKLKVHWTREFRLGCIVTPSHPLAIRGSIGFSELAEHPAVFQDASLSIRKMLEARHGWIFEKARNPVVVNSIQLMKLLVASGQYLAVTSELDAGPEIRGGSLRFIPISDDDLFFQRFSVVSNTTMPETNAVRSVIAIAIEILERHVEATLPQNPSRSGSFAE